MRKKQIYIPPKDEEVIIRKGNAFTSGMRNFLLILWGICFAFIVLETFLWSVGTYLSHQRGGLVGKSQGDEQRIRIVALGESTTAPLTGPAWPEFLEQELNRRVGGDRYRVYNLGVSGSNSSAIYRRLVTEAVSLRPDIVITMMGVNDIKYLALPAAAPTSLTHMWEKIKSTRSYKLIAILMRLFGGKNKRVLTERAISCHADEMGDAVWRERSLPEYETFIRKLYPDRYIGKFLNSKKDQEAEQVLTRFLAEYPFSYEAYEVLVDHLASRSRWKDVVFWTTSYLEMQPLIQTCIMANPTMAAEVKDVRKRHVEDIGVFMDSLLGIANNMKNEKVHGDWEYYEAIKAQVGAQGKPSNFNTAEIYRKINQFLLQKKIRYIAMQYPLLSIRTLQDMFPNDTNVLFVSNEYNFRNALKSLSYDDLFVDNFAGVFGHTTALGSRLIASSAADLILSDHAQK